MAGKNRNRGKRAKKIATLGAATVTATALTAGIAPMGEANAAVVAREAALQADVRPFPPPDQIPDLTGGLGSAGYDVAQELGAQFLTALVQSISLEALAQAAGLDPQSIASGLLNEAVSGILGGALGQVPIDLSGVLQPLAAEVLTPLVTEILRDLPIGGALTDPLLNVVAGVVVSTLAGELLDLNAIDNVGELLAVLGLDLSNPLDLSGDPIPGLNIVTTGSPFTLLKLFGVDLGWVPPFPNSVAQDINNTEYLKVGLAGLLENLGVELDPIDLDLLGLGLGSLDPGDILDRLPDAVAVRIPIVVGFQLGAFAAGAAYQQVVDDLPNQPGGANYTGTNPLLGSFTVLPMVLIDNPGRANGGLFARAYPLFRLMGIDTVTPDTQVQSSTTGNSPLNDIQLLGLTVGGANLIPVKIDATAEYLPLSDFAAWPNPFTMTNNVAAALFPTYILRDQSIPGIVTDLTGELVGQLTADITDYLADPGDDPTKGPKLNIYYTLDAKSLPLLEPTYLAVDLVNLFTGLNLNNPIGTALSPALTTLVNLGYTDVRRVENADGSIEYVRDFDDSDVPTAFGSFPDVDWEKVPADVATQLVRGVQKAIGDGLVNQNPVPSPLTTLLGLLGLGDALPSGGSILNLPDLTAGLPAGDTVDVAAPQSDQTTKFEPQEVTETKATDPDTTVVNLASPQDGTTTTTEAAGKVDGDVNKLTADVDEARAEIEAKVAKANEQVKVSAQKSRERTQKAVKDAQDRVNKIAENGRKQIKAVADGLEKAVKDTRDAVKKATAKPAKKTQTGSQNDGDDKKDDKKDKDAA
ncbi:AAA family ATPase [Mycolicibacterium goodii]|uniref:AAA family ATPase n=1 Tax=Mycolicibacterium goodii TaxID=134601 RepID=UPI001BDBF576|nr:AAA family ATPase [Mycolicibacterium goodii]MBU8833571.1 AAA family ATPase [Mycolicibacterium goodii]